MRPSVRVCARMLTKAAGLALLAAGWSCQPSYPNAVRDENGQPVRRVEINDILNDTTLSDDQKRQALADLGITDPALIDLLIRNGTGK